MKVEILETLKGFTTWRKGTIFDDIVSPIPGDILKEVSSGSRAVRVIAENKFAVTKTENEIIEPVEAETGFEWAELPPVAMLPQEKIPTRQQETVDTKQKILNLIPHISDKMEAELQARMTALGGLPQKKKSEENACPKCNWTGKTAAALKRHITMVHR